MLGQVIALLLLTLSIKSPISEPSLLGVHTVQRNIAMQPIPTPQSTSTVSGMTLIPEKPSKTIAELEVLVHNEEIKYSRLVSENIRKLSDTKSKTPHHDKYSIQGKYAKGINT